MRLFHFPVKCINVQKWWLQRGRLEHKKYTHSNIHMHPKQTIYHNLLTVFLEGRCKPCDCFHYRSLLGSNTIFFRNKIPLQSHISQHRYCTPEHVRILYILPSCSLVRFVYFVCASSGKAWMKSKTCSVNKLDLSERLIPLKQSPKRGCD